MKKCAILLCLLALFLTACNGQEPTPLAKYFSPAPADAWTAIKSGNNFRIMQLATRPDWVRYELLSNDGEVVFYMETGSPGWFELADGLVQFNIDTGTTGVWSRFYSPEKNALSSRSLRNVTLLACGRIAFVQRESTGWVLILRDIFDAPIFYARFSLGGFIPAADITADVYIHCTGDGRVMLTAPATGEVRTFAIVAPIFFTDTVRIHADGPYFTLQRIAFTAYEIVPEERACSTFTEFETRIRVYDENNSLVQEITGLRQAASPLIPIYHDWMQLSFIDFNFDGYVDMRLFRHLRSESGDGRVWGWLWDSEQGQFVLNASLNAIIPNVVISVDEENETWGFGWSENDGELHTQVHFAYENGHFIEVRREVTQFFRLHESHDKADEFMIHIDVTWRGDGWWPDWLYDASIRVSVYNGQHELVLETCIPEVWGWYFMHGFRFIDFNRDGYLDIALLLSPAIDAHYSVWLWDSVAQQFIFSEALYDFTLYHFYRSSLRSFVMPDGIILIIRRYATSVTELTYQYINGQVVLIMRAQHEFSTEENDIPPGHMRVTVHDYISGTQTVEVSVEVRRW